MKIFKAISASALALTMLLPVVGCGEEEGGNEYLSKVKYNAEIAGDSATFTADDMGLKYNAQALQFVKKGDVYGINIVRTRDGTAVYDSEKPVVLTLKGQAKTLMGGYTTSECADGYQSVQKTDYGFLCKAVVTTENGSVFGVGDCYYMDSGAFAIDRTVTVLEANGNDKGFESGFRFVNVGDKEYDVANPNFDVFLPAILYKDLEYSTGGTIGNSLSSDKLLVKETRMGMPMSYIRDGKTNSALSIFHLEPEITVNGVSGGGFDGAVDDRLEYASMGVTLKGGVGVEFCYPCAEGPTTYDNGSTWTRRFHEVEANNSHEYKVGLFAEENSNYQDSTVRAYKTAYNANETQPVDDINLDGVYNAHMYLFDTEYKEFNDGSAGVPWSISLETGEIDGGYSFQMGFVGQQTAVGYHLLMEGYKLRDQRIIDRGKRILNFWTSSAIFKSGDALPYVWYVADAEGCRDYPAFLRCFVDGMEGVLDGYRIAKKNGENMTQWYNAVIKIADFLVSHQNSDGSFNRAYLRNGSVAPDVWNGDSRVQGSSKVNTPVAVRFLGKIYELTGQEKYKTSMLDAADYCYNDIYKGIGKYIGGTPDNKNAIDKEASVYALYAFNAAYQISGREKYLNAAEHAAINTMSWIYAYDFAVPAASQTYSKVNCFEEGGACGFSIISTYAKSSADNYSAYVYYEMFKLYILTGDTFYRDCAIMLQYNTKSSTDYTGKFNYGGNKHYTALGPEATKIADFDFRGVGTWLPWSGIANVEPMANMRHTFGDADITKVSDDLTALRSTLKAYGVGGRTL